MIDYLYIDGKARKIRLRQSPTLEDFIKVLFNFAKSMGSNTKPDSVRKFGGNAIPEGIAYFKSIDTNILGFAAYQPSVNYSVDIPTISYERNPMLPKSNSERTPMLPRTVIGDAILTGVYYDRDRRLEPFSINKSDEEAIIEMYRKGTYYI